MGLLGLFKKKTMCAVCGAVTKPDIYRDDNGNTLCFNCHMNNYMRKQKIPVATPVSSDFVCLRCGRTLPIKYKHSGGICADCADPADKTYVPHSEPTSTTPPSTDFVCKRCGKTFPIKYKCSGGICADCYSYLYAARSAIPPVSPDPKNSPLSNLVNTPLSEHLSPFVFSGDTLERYINKDHDGTVEIPSHVKEIGEEAFAGCKISTVVIPPSCSVFKQRAFARCTNLKKVVFMKSDAKKFFFDQVFYGCTALEEIDLPHSSSTSNGFFEGCTALKRVRFSDDSRSIGQRAFKSCIKLEEVQLPSSLYSIQFMAFSGCSSLKSINLPHEVAKIGEKAFENCINLREITLPKGCPVIQPMCFSRCKSLSQVTFSEGVRTIAQNAFVNCNLTHVTVPSTVINIAENAFDSGVTIEGFKKPTPLFPGAQEDILGSPSLGERVKPIYHSLFPIPPLNGYESAHAAINLMTGFIHRVDAKSVSYGVVQSMDTVISGLPRKEFDSYDHAGKYRTLNEDNWRDFIPDEELEKAAKNILPHRFYDDSYTPEDEIPIDGLYIKLNQRFGVTAFYFRKVTRGYRLFKAESHGRSPIMLFDDKSCSEEFLYKLFLGFGEKLVYTFSDIKIDIALSKVDFSSIIASCPELFNFQYIGKEKRVNAPISIYGNDILEAVLWKDGEAIPCADHPEIKKVYDALRAVFKQDGENA